MTCPETETEQSGDADAGEDPPGIAYFSAEDFVAVDAEAPIAASRKIYCQCLGSLYQKAATAAEAEGNAKAANVYGLLAAVTQIHFKPHDRAEPYGPMLVVDHKRSIIPGDLRGPQSDVLAAIAPDIKNAGLRALLADIAWLNDRKLAAMGQLAIGSFCAAVRAVIDGNAELFFEDAKATSHNGAKMLRRACQIATLTGWKEPEAGSLKTMIATLGESAFNESDARGFLNIGELDCDFRITAPQVTAERAQALAQLPELDPDTARDVWELAARAHRQRGDDAERNRCLTNAAECYVRMAEAAGLKGMAASSWLMDAIKALRGIAGTKARRQELEGKLREAQSSIADEMGPISTEIDISDLVDQARKTVSDLTLAQALLEFAKLEGSPSPETLRDEARKQAEENPLSSIIPMSIHDDEGKMVAKSPGLSTSGDDDDIAVRHLIGRHEGVRRQFAATGSIEPARRLIMAQHPLEARDLLPIARLSPFVTPGHEDIFALGFARFFGGDFISALHILVPQLESSLRHVLKQAAVDTSSMQSDMTQENRTLSVLLDKDRATLEKIFGAAIVLEIENLFDFEGGPSLRHQLAHGLLSTGACFSYDAIYACWFIYRLCCLPLFRHWQQVADAYVRM